MTRLSTAVGMIRVGRTIRRKLIGASLLGATLPGLPLAGCVGPNFVPPVPVTAGSRNFLDTGGAVRTPVAVLPGTSGAPSNVEWWAIFKDPELSKLESRVADRNLDVRTATLRIAQSRANVASTASQALPTLSGTFSDYRQQFSQNGLFSLIPLQSLGSLGGGAAGGAGGLGADLSQANRITNGFNNYLIGFNAAWELDLWGRVARSVEAADAQYLQSEETRRNMLVSELAEVARDYVSLRGTQELIRIARDNLKIDQEIFEVTKVRQEKGLVTGLDFEQAASQVESVRAQIPTLQAQEIQQINMISFLLDEPPLGLSAELIAAKPVPRNPPRVPIGLPSELARRRPDIREAEAQLHAATANIGVAIAEFFPSVRLNADPTLQALDPKNLFKGTSLQYMQFGPSVTLPIFQGGRLKANLTMMEKSQQQAAISYHRAVLNAWHDVVNQLTAYRTEQQRRDRLVAQVGHARQALAFARSRYDQGVADFTTLLQNAQTVLTAEQQLAQSTTNISTDLVALYLALGGGWEQTYPDPHALPPPEQVPYTLAVAPGGATPLQP